jgi:putative transposase
MPTTFSRPRVWQDGGTARLRRKLVRLSGAGNPARGLAFSQSSRLKAAAENHRAAQRNKNLVIQASACVSQTRRKSPLWSTSFKMYRRNLPHWHPPGAAVFVTWRLAGTLPSFNKCVDDGHAFAERDLWLDRTIEGPQWLRRFEVAQCVVTNLLDGAGSRYELHAFVVMPNHVHLLLTPWVELATIIRAMKGKSARQANALLDRTGLPFWQDESFDHWIRHPRQFEQVRVYIERNPVRAGLVKLPEQWPYSSASWPQAEACITKSLFLCAARRFSAAAFRRLDWLKASPRAGLPAPLNWT